MSDWISLVFNIAPADGLGVDVMVVTVDAIGIAVVVMVMQTQLTLSNTIYGRLARRSTLADIFDKSAGGFLFGGNLFFVSILIVLGRNLLRVEEDVKTVGFWLFSMTVDLGAVPIVLTIIGTVITAALFARYYIAVFFFIPFRALVEPFAVPIPKSAAERSDVERHDEQGDQDRGGDAPEP